jgi:DNA-binding GntR family transcriptional regulator
MTSATNVPVEGAAISAPEELKSGSLNTKIYNAIKQRILSNRLRPGTKLVHEQLANELRVSRTPVREALERLYSEGYIVHILRRGFFVAEIDETEARELYELREALEVFALRKVFETTETWPMEHIRALNGQYRVAIDSLGTRDRMLTDRDFHLGLARLAGNGRVVDTLASIFDRVILKRRVEGYLPTRGPEAYKEHIALIEALADHDAASSEAILRGHIRSAWGRLHEHLQVLADHDPDDLD